MNKTEILHEITTYKLIQLYNKTIKKYLFNKFRENK